MNSNQRLRVSRTPAATNSQLSFITDHGTFLVSSASGAPKAGGPRHRPIGRQRVCTPPHRMESSVQRSWQLDFSPMRCSMPSHAAFQQPSLPSRTKGSPAPLRAGLGESSSECGGRGCGPTTEKGGPGRWGKGGTPPHLSMNPTIVSIGPLVQWQAGDASAAVASARFIRSALPYSGTTQPQSSGRNVPVGLLALSTADSESGSVAVESALAPDR